MLLEAGDLGKLHTVCNQSGMKMLAQTHLQNGSLCTQIESAAHPGKGNLLLASLSPDLFDRLAPHFKWVALKQGERLHKPSEIIEKVYFPIDCLLSITITMSDGAVIETSMVGRHEMLGIDACMNRNATIQTEHTVQIAGSAIEMSASILRKEFDCNQELRDVLLRYTQAYVTQLSQTAACNGTHVLEQRLARWLLEVQMRIESGQLKLTHEFIANMLGVRRSGVSLAAQTLQNRRLIRCSRGRIHILDQAGLEDFSCECFKITKNEYSRLLEINCKRSI